MHLVIIFGKKQNCFFDALQYRKHYVNLESGKMSGLRGF